MSCFLNMFKIFVQYSSFGLSRVDPRALAGVSAIRFNLASSTCDRLMKSSLTIPLMPWRAPRTSKPCFLASRTAPMRDWLMTAVGPPPWAIKIFIFYDDVFSSFIQCNGGIPKFGIVDRFAVLPPYPLQG